MTKCICGVNISPDNVHYHQGCGKKIFQDSDMTLLSIKETVAENNQRVIKFPYTGEVVDFLLARIDTLTKQNDALAKWNTSLTEHVLRLDESDLALTKKVEVLRTGLEFYRDTDEDDGGKVAVEVLAATEKDGIPQLKHPAT